MLWRKSRSPSSWRVLKHGTPVHAPLDLQEWLRDTGSLTRKLEEALLYPSDKHLELKILIDHKQNLVRSEREFEDFKLFKR